MVALLTVFGGLDVSVVAGQALWMPIGFGLAITHLLIGWGTDWQRFPDSPRWTRARRRSAYFALAVLALLMVSFTDLLTVTLVFGAMDLLLTTSPASETGGSGRSRSSSASL